MRLIQRRSTAQPLAGHADTPDAMDPVHTKCSKRKQTNVRSRGRAGCGRGVQPGGEMGVSTRQMITSARY
jgi:hypothetical protein